MTDMLRMEWRDRALKAEAEIKQLRGQLIQAGAEIKQLRGQLIQAGADIGRLTRAATEHLEHLALNASLIADLLFEKKEVAAFLDGMADRIDDPLQEVVTAAECRTMAARLRGEK